MIPLPVVLYRSARLAAWAFAAAFALWLTAPRAEAAARDSAMTMTPDSSPGRMILSFSRDEAEEATEYSSRYGCNLAVPGAGHPTIRLLDYEAFVDAGGQSLGLMTRAEIESVAPPMPWARIVAYQYGGQFRSWRLARVQLTPNLHAPWSDGSQAWIRIVRAQVELTFEGAAADGGAPRDDPMKERLLQHLVVNPPAMLNALAVADSPPDDPNVQTWRERISRAAAEGRAARIEVRHEGPILLSSAELAAAGLDVSAVNPRTMRLYESGRESPIHLLAGDVPESWSLVFVAAPFSPREVYQRFYFLIAESGAEPARMSVRLPDGAESDATPAESGVGRLTLAPRNHYFHKIPLTGEFSHWYWMDIEPDRFQDVALNLPEADPQGEQAQLTVKFPKPDPRSRFFARLYWNRQPIGQLRSENQDNAVFTKAIPANRVRAGENTLSIEYAAQGLAGAAATLLVSEVDVEYPRKLSASEGRIDFRLPDAPGRQVRVEGFETAPLAIDWTDPAAPAVLTALPDAATPGAWRLAPPATQDARLSAFSPGAAGRAASIEPVRAPTTLTPENGADAIAIAPPDFLPPLEGWKTRRAAQGRRVHLVNLDELYLAFNFGNPHPAGIQRFARHAYERWSGAPPGWILLVGESSDLEGPLDALPEEAHPDQLPVFRSNRPAPEPRGDHEYTLLQSGDALPDIAIARIPAATIEDLEFALRRIEDYETRTPAGPWRARNMFIADDEPVFDEVIAHLEENAVPGAYQQINLMQSDYPYTPTFATIDRKESTAATDALIDRFNEGALTVSYFGHGGPNVWSHERLFHLSEMPRLDNGLRLPLVSIFSCDCAWLDYPLEPARVSIGEKFLLNRSGGAAAVFGPTGGATPRQHESLVSEFFHGLFDKRLPTLGEAALFAKLAVYLEKRDAMVIEQYTLIGDGLTPLQSPASALELATEPEAILAGYATTMRISGVWTGVDEGHTTAFLRIAGQEDRLIDQRNLPLVDGRISYLWQTPADLPPGRHAIVIYASNPRTGQEALGKVDFEAFADAYELRLLRPGQSDRIYDEGESVQIALQAVNRLSAPARDLNVLIRSPGLSRPILQERINIGPSQMRPYEIELGLQRGMRILEFFVYGPGRQPEDAAAAERATRYFPVAAPDGDQALLATAAAAMRLAPDAPQPDTPVEVHVPLWNLGAAPSSAILCQLRAADGRNLGEIQEIDPLAPREMRWVRFALPEGLKTGAQSLTFLAALPGAEGEDPAVVASASAEFLIEGAADLAFVPGSLKFEGDAFVDGQTVFFSADIVNLGGREAPPAVVEAFKNGVVRDADLIRSSFDDRPLKTPPLKPGETWTARMRWDDLHVSGERQALMVVNRNPTFAEYSADNNAIAGRVTIRPRNNFFVAGGGLRVDPPTARPGQRVVLTAEVRSEQPMVPRQLPVVFFSGNDRDGLAPIRKSERGPETESDRFAVSQEIEAGVNANLFAIELNPDRRVSESIPTDNRATARVELILGLDDLRKSSDGKSYDLMEAISSSALTAARWTPEGTLACGDFSEVPPLRVAFSSDNVAGDYAGAADQGTETDNRWRLLEGLLEAGPEEDASPIRVIIPLQNVEAKAFDVSLLVDSSATARSAPSSRLRARLPGWDDFRDFDFTKDLRPWLTQEQLIGRCAAIGVLEFDLDDDPGGAWSIARGVNLRPLIGECVSPAIDLGNGAGATLRFQCNVDAPGDSLVAWQWRTGRPGPDGNPAWSAWDRMELDAAGLSPELAANTTFVQWKARLLAGADSLPAIRDMKFWLAE